MKVSRMCKGMVATACVLVGFSVYPSARIQIEQPAVKVRPAGGAQQQVGVEPVKGLRQVKNSLVLAILDNNHPDIERYIVDLFSIGKRSIDTRSIDGLRRLMNFVSDNWEDVRVATYPGQEGFEFAVQFIMNKLASVNARIERLSKK